MLLYLTNYLAQFESGFGVFHYLTMRAILSALTALLLSFIIGPKMIARLTLNQVGQPVREFGPSSHLPKAGTPTMGGALIITAIVFSTVMWADLENRFIWVVLFVTLAFGVIGYVDDYKKLILRNPAGLSARQKLFWQSSAAILAAVVLYMMAVDEASTSLLIPYFKDLAIPLGMFQIVVTFLFIVGFSNAVNLTDGLDGLAIMPTVLVGGALGVFAYVTGNVNFSQYLGIPYVSGSWGNPGILRRAGRRRAWIPVVQHISGSGIHGRYRCTIAWCSPWCCSGRRPAGINPRHHGRSVCRRNCVGHHSGCFVQADWPAGFPDGAATPSF